MTSPWRPGPAWKLGDQITLHHGDFDHSQETDGQLLEAGADTAAFLEPSHDLLDEAAPAVHLRADKRFLARNRNIHAGGSERDRGDRLKIAHGIHRLKVPIPDNPLGHLNCYLVEGSRGWLMIDTGWNSPDAFRSLEAGLKDTGLKITDLRSVVITHGHIDHIGLAGRIREASPGTEIWTHQWEAHLISSRKADGGSHLDEAFSFVEHHGVPSSVLSRLKSANRSALGILKSAVSVPDRDLYGGEILSTGVHDLEVIWTPGHSPGHICLYEQSNRFLFSGDHILPTISPNIGYHIHTSDNPLGDYLHSVEKLRFLPVTKVLPAHEDIFTDFDARLDQIVEHHTQRKMEMQRVVAEGHTDAYAIASRIPWGVRNLRWNRFPPMHKQAALLETIAHLECLRWEGKVTRVIRGGMFHYEGA